MRVALDATPLTLTSGGLRRYVEDLSLALAREYPGDHYSLLSDQPFTLPEGAPQNLTGARSTERRYWSFGLRRELRKLKANVFHGTNFEVPYFGTTPSILTIHDLSPWKNPAWHVNADRVRVRTPWLVRLGRAKLILTVSEAIAGEVVSHFGVSPEKVRAVPPAASDLFRQVAPASPPPRPYFLFVGTLEPRKNVAALVEAWRAVREATGTDLLIAGRTRADFVPVADEPGLTMMGEVPDAELSQLYANAQAFVYPTLYEGFGLPVLEAMQCGCPVITSRDPAVMEVSGGAALHANSVAEFASTMLAIAQNAELRDKHRSAGLARARDFSWQVTARRTHEVYDEAVRLP
ncbi:MAG: glycosyltransferase family 1 protein [Bryobacterales bacterium]|nr:glycosyltransferase family 1 protein [Bryobacterales bacterium]